MSQPIVLSSLSTNKAFRPPPTTLPLAMASRRQKTKNSNNRRATSGVNNGATGAGFGGVAGGKMKEPLWQCVKGCGACCKLQKAPSFGTPEEIFDDPSDVQLYKSMIGPDGWCIHYDKSNRLCSIYDDRPYFCRVEAHVFEKLYGIKKRSFNKAACSSCKCTIKAIYGVQSKELKEFERAIYSK